MPIRVYTALMSEADRLEHDFIEARQECRREEAIKIGRDLIEHYERPVHSPKTAGDARRLVRVACYLHQMNDHPEWGRRAYELLRTCAADREYGRQLVEPSIHPTTWDELDHHLEEYEDQFRAVFRHAETGEELRDEYVCDFLSYCLPTLGDNYGFIQPED